MHGTPHQVTYYAEQSLYPLIVSVPVSTMFWFVPGCSMYCLMVSVPVSVVVSYLSVPVSSMPFVPNCKSFWLFLGTYIAFATYLDV